MLAAQNVTEGASRSLTDGRTRHSLARPTTQNHPWRRRERDRQESLVRAYNVLDENGGRCGNRTGDFSLPKRTPCHLANSPNVYVSIVGCNYTRRIQSLHDIDCANMRDELDIMV